MREIRSPGSVRGVPGNRYSYRDTWRLLASLTRSLLGENYATMKILWLTNIALPEACMLMNEKASPWGGWLISASEELSREQGIQLSLASPKPGIGEVKRLEGERITFYLFPPVSVAAPRALGHNSHLKGIVEAVRPEIVHIFGTELPQCLAMVNVCQGLAVQTIISIQGLLSVIARHYLSGLSDEIIRRFTFRDFIKQDSLRQQQQRFLTRGELEVQALKKVKHVVGRTTWDRACTSQINPDVRYHFCNETLRREFYQHKWDIERCEKFTIFVSQASYPYKGFHFLLEAMPIIVKRFPQTKVFVAGPDITKSGNLKDRLKMSSYSKYIKELIGHYGLQHKVVFTGMLDEKEICQRYLRSHVFVSAASIENSPNSLGEAMILGVPCVASNVGGVSDLLKDKLDGFLYQHDAPYMLAHYVCQIFADDLLATKISASAREQAGCTYNVAHNNRTLLEIYRLGCDE